MTSGLRIPRLYLDLRVSKSSKPECHSRTTQNPPPERRMPVWAKLTAFGGLGLAIVIYLAMYFVSSKFLDEAMRALQI